MHLQQRDSDLSNFIDKHGMFSIGKGFESSWEKQHNITFTDLTPDNCKENSEYLVAKASGIESCKLKIEDGIYVSKFTYNGTEYKMRLGRSDKYTEKEVQVYQWKMYPSEYYSTYFFMSYEDGEYIVYPFMYTVDWGSLSAYAITPVWEMIGESSGIDPILDRELQDVDRFNEYLALQPDWVD